MTLLQLEYFLNVASSGSTQQTSQALSVSQSTISTSIRSLEDELNVTLFDRSPRGMTLTAAGRRLQASAKLITDQVRTIQLEMRQYSCQERPFRIGIPIAFSYVYWPEIYLDLQKRYPNLRLEIVHRTFRTLLVQLKEKKLDMVIGAVSLGGSDLFEHEIFRTDPHIYVTVSQDSPLASRPVLRFEELAQYPVLHYKGGETSLMYFSEKLRPYLPENAASPLICDQFSTLLRMIRKNAGIGYLTISLNGSFPGLVSIPLEESRSGCHFSSYWNAQSEQASTIRKVNQILRSHLAP